QRLFQHVACPVALVAPPGQREVRLDYSTQNHRDHVICSTFTATLIRIKAAQLCRPTDFSWSDRDDLTQPMLLLRQEKSHLFDAATRNIEALATKDIVPWMTTELRFRGRDKFRGDYEAISPEGTLVECDGDAVPVRTVLGAADQHRRRQSAPA